LPNKPKTGFFDLNGCFLIRLCRQNLLNFFNYGIQEIGLGDSGDLCIKNNLSITNNNHNSQESETRIQKHQPRSGFISAEFAIREKGAAEK